MRALAALRMVWASASGLDACFLRWMGDGGGDVGDVVCEEAAGRRALRVKILNEAHPTYKSARASTDRDPLSL